MIETLVPFALLTYGLAFLLADAKIFGCPITDYLQDPNDIEHIKTVGMLPFRQLFFRFRFCRSLLSCYFCLGVWCGAMAHLLLVASHHHGLGNLGSYLLLGHGFHAIAIGTVDAALIGGPVCYIVDLAVKALEKATT